MEFFLQQTVNALALGGTYAMLALGLAIIFSVMGMINFAHGELMTITGYILMYCGLAHLPFFLAAPLAIAGTMLAAMAMERLAFRPVRNASGGDHAGHQLRCGHCPADAVFRTSSPSAPSRCCSRISWPSQCPSVT